MRREDEVVEREDEVVGGARALDEHAARAGDDDDEPNEVLRGELRVLPAAAAGRQGEGVRLALELRSSPRKS